MSLPSRIHQDFKNDDSSQPWENPNDTDSYEWTSEVDNGISPDGTFIISNSNHHRDIAIQSFDICTPIQCENGWADLPGELFEMIAVRLKLADLASCSRVCKSWNQHSQEDHVWKKISARDYKIHQRARLRKIQEMDGFSSWKEEYRRLWCDVPAVQVQLIRDHRDEVLHVSFSHNGDMFSTCSKDGFVKCWDSSVYPFCRKYQHNMKTFSWKYTQFSSFNRSDTLLLVSGVHFGPISTSGEIIVFSLEDDFSIRCKVRNKPYDIFGSWLDDNHLFSGNLHWTTQMESCCSLWISKASQELESERISVMNRAYKFLNVNGSSLRTLAVAHPFGEDSDEVSLIFSTGDQTYIPHQIGVKRLNKRTIPFPGLTDQRTIQEAMAENERHLHDENNQDVVQYDTIDHTFNLNAQIIGLALSPDTRYLFANCRSWPDNVHIEDPFQPPPISSEVEIRCFDLQTLEQVPLTYRAHRAYTPSEECFFIFMDVAVDFVASGAEDSNGYIWHRHHNIKLSTLSHQSVVNCVAFNPADQETLVTVSDDYTVRVWFSRRKCMEMGLDYVGQKICGIDKSVQCKVDNLDLPAFDVDMIDLVSFE